MTLPSLRATIAEGMQALAAAKFRQPPFGEGDYLEVKRLTHGAATLAWCDQFDGPLDDEDVAELHALRAFSRDLGDVFDSKMPAKERVERIQALIAKHDIDLY